jgi:pimeloyl-ACP methyl ester carboxylesterase
MNTAIGTETAQPDIYVRETGSRGSPAVLFLHGVGNSGAMWQRHMAELEGLHCLAPDLPGFGRSNSLPWTSRQQTDRALCLRTPLCGLDRDAAGALVRPETCLMWSRSRQRWFSRSRNHPETLMAHGFSGWALQGSNL